LATARPTPRARSATPTGLSPSRPRTTTARRALSRLRSP
jgi:hypothetical protein